MKREELLSALAREGFWLENGQVVQASHVRRNTPRQDTPPTFLSQKGNALWKKVLWPKYKTQITRSKNPWGTSIELYLGICQKHKITPWENRRTTPINLNDRHV